jgi:formate-dependent nitrite reductase membrane component NrfD
MKSYEWMVTYTPQTDWIKGGGVVVWLSFFTGIFGSGAYLASLYFNNLTGMVLSWLIIVVIKGGLHVAHTKRPLRLWRMVLKVRTSWIARGTVFTACTALFGAVQIILTYHVPGTTAEFMFKVLAGIAVFTVMIYAGFTINYISGIPFWNSSLLPVTLMSWGVLGGLALLSVIAPDEAVTDAVTAVSRIVLIVTIVLTAIYLWNALYAGDASKESMKEMVRGVLFWIGVVLIGFIIPLIIMFSGSAVGASSAVAFLVCEIIGSLAFTYSVFKVGVYRPLI